MPGALALREDGQLVVEAAEPKRGASPGSSSTRSRVGVRTTLWRYAAVTRAKLATSVHHGSANRVTP